MRFFESVAKQVFNKEGIIQKGIIVRHLMLPTLKEDTKKILNYLYSTYKDNIYISIMNQYTPLPHVAHIPALNRPVSREEYDRVVRFALAIGIEQGFCRKVKPPRTASFLPLTTKDCRERLIAR